jgi:hypothetical protein
MIKSITKSYAEKSREILKMAEYFDFPLSKYLGDINQDSVVRIQVLPDSSFILTPDS